MAFDVTAQGGVGGEVAAADSEFIDFAFGPDPEVERLALEEGLLPAVDNDALGDEGQKPEIWARPRQLEWHDGRWLVDATATVWRHNLDSGSAWEVFRGDPHADDVQQGGIGNCWFISAMACLAEFRRGQLIKALFQPRIQKGRYDITLYVGGLPRIVTIDDRLPATCSRRRESLLTVERRPCRLIYCGTARLQLFASLLEKAYAKYCGSYEALQSGNADEAFEALTGWPVITLNLDGDGGDVSAKGAATLDEDLLWAQLLSSKESGFLMALSSRGDAGLQGTGLRPSHCYSILELHEVGSSSLQRLVKIRNPHGAGEWGGAWSRTSSLWTPELRRRMNYRSDVQDSDDGVFYMRFADVRRFFHRCTICQVHSASEGWMRSRGELEVSVSSPSAVQLEVFEGSPLVITLSQEPSRVPAAAAHRVDFQFVVLRLWDGTSDRKRFGALVARGRYRTDFSMASDGLVLEPGRYLVVPLVLQAQSAMIQELGGTISLGFCIASAKAILAEAVPLAPLEAATALRHFVQSPRASSAGPTEELRESGASRDEPYRVSLFSADGNSYQWVDNLAGSTLRVSIEVRERSPHVYLSIPPTLRNLQAEGSDVLEAVIPPGHGMLVYATLITDRYVQSRVRLQQIISQAPALAAMLPWAGRVAEEDTLIEPGLHSLVALDQTRSASMTSRV